MTATILHLAGERLMLDPAGAFFWPAAGLLAVADLHLEKGTAAARRGSLVPPWDTRLTLDRLAGLLRHWQPSRVVLLGDSFHDRHAHARLPAAEAARLAQMAAQAEFVWVSGNHDPLPPDGLAGLAVAEWRHGPLAFRHQGRAPPAERAGPGRVRRTAQESGSRAAGLPRARRQPPDSTGTAMEGSAAEGVVAEICGHHHPKAKVRTRAGWISRACFVAGPQRLMLPAFGTYTGGLDVAHPEIAGLFPGGGQVFLLGRQRLFSFALGHVGGPAAPPGG